MKTELVIRTPPDISPINGDTLVQWSEYTTLGEQQGELHLTPINDIKKTLSSIYASINDEQDQQITVLLGGVHCFYRKILLNPAQKKHLSTALPYLIEEQLAQDIDTMHMVCGQPDKTLNVPVAAIAHETLQQILAVFTEAELSPTHIIPEAQCYPSDTTDNDVTTLLLDQTVAILTQHEQVSVALDYKTLLFMLDRQAEGEATSTAIAPPTGRINILYSDHPMMPTARSNLATLVDKLSLQSRTVEKQPIADSMLEYLVRCYFKHRQSSQLVDFRQGSYRCPKKASRAIRRWKPVVALASAWLIIALVFSVAKGVFYQHQRSVLWQESITHYLKLFPNDRQAQQAHKKLQLSFNVKQLMANRFKLLDTQPVTSSFLPILQRLSNAFEAMNANTEINPDSLNYNQATGMVILEISAQTTDALQRFLGHIQQTGLTGKLDHTRQESQRIVARVAISNQGRTSP